MGKLGPWVFVLVLAVVVAAYWAIYVRTPGGEPSVPVAGRNSKTENTDPAVPRDPRHTPQTDDHPDPAKTQDNDKKTEDPPEDGGKPAASELYRLAIKAEEAGDAKCIELYRKVVEEAGGSKEATRAAVKLAEYYHKQRDASEALKYLKIALSGELSGEQRESLRQKLDQLAYEQAFDPQENPRVSYYVVRPNDTLSGIGKRYDVPWELLMRLNRLKSDRIRIDDRLKVVKGPFDVVIEKSKFKLSLQLGNKYVKSYRVGVGKEDSTPTGVFKVKSKLEKPDWYRPGKIIKYGDPENALGTRWIGFTKGCGIHGTWEPETIGSQCSDGCVRMLNKDVEELFGFLTIKNSKVTIKR